MLIVPMDELVKKAKAGDKMAEKEIFDNLFVRFKYLAKRRVGENDCEDLAQEACMTVLEKYKTEKFEINFLAWAYGILKNKIGNHFQTLKRRSSRELSLDDNLPAAAARHDPDLTRILLQCLRKMVASFSRYARALNLAYQGFETEIICEKLGVTRNNYYVLLNRGRSLLQTCVEEGEPRI